MGCLYNCLFNSLSWTSWTSRFSYILSVFIFTFPFLYDGLFLWCVCFVLFKATHLYVNLHCLSSITIIFSELLLTLCFFSYKMKKIWRRKTRWWICPMSSVYKHRLIVNFIVQDYESLEPFKGSTMLYFWRRKWQPTPVFLPGKYHGWRSLVGYSPWDRKESDTTEQLHSHMLYFTKSMASLCVNRWSSPKLCA